VSKDRSTSIHFCSEVSFLGDKKSETAKSLLACKAVPRIIFSSDTFLFDEKMMRGVPHEYRGNMVSR